MASSNLALEVFAEKIKENVKGYYAMQVNEDMVEVKFWVNNVLVILEPQLEKSGSIYTTIEMIYYTQLYNEKLARLYISSKAVKLEDNNIGLKLTCEYEEIKEDPAMLIYEDELFMFLNELNRMNEIQDFIEFAQEVFKQFSGLV